MTQKTLLIIRHATAENLGNANFPDFDRELISTGIIEAARMGKKLHDENLVPAHIYSSSAKRALDTAGIFAEQWQIDRDHIQSLENLYGGGPRAYLAFVNSLPEEQTRVAVFGHNPDISFFVEYLCKSDIGQMDQASVAVVQIENLPWAAVSAGTATLKHYLTI